MAVILDLRQGGSPEEQLIYLKEQLERFLTELEDRSGGVQSIQMIPEDDSLKLIVTDMTGEVSEAEIQNANNIVTIAVQYYLSTSPSEPTGSATGWQADQPEPEEGKYIWQRSVIIWADGSSASTIPVCPESGAKALAKAERALTKAEQAEQDAARAKTAAENAESDAAAAAQSASEAESSASSAQSSATAAAGSASEAAASARSADSHADAAAFAAGKAASSASDAATSASDAADSASAAQGSASAAQSSASAAAQSASNAANDAARANTAANSALTQLSIVEDVAGTLAWIQEHGTYTLTTDTIVQEGTIYFTYNSTTHDYEPIVSPDPSKNPHTEGWYVLDVSDSQTEYIMAHLAVTSRGLWILPGGKGTGTTPASGESQADSDARQGADYKVLLASDGMYLYDGSGQLVVKYGSSIDLGGSRPFHIGTNDCYILFTPASGSTPASITIGGGANVSIGTNKTLADVLTDIDISTRQTDSGAEITVGDHTVSLNNGIDAAVLRIDSSRGTVFKNNQVSTVLTVAIYIGSLRITNITDLRAKFGSSAHLQWYWQRLGEDTYGIIVDSDSKLSNDGFSLTLTPADVDTKVTFKCELIV